MGRTIKTLLLSLFLLSLTLISLPSSCTAHWQVEGLRGVARFLHGESSSRLKQGDFLHLSRGTLFLAKGASLLLKNSRGFSLTLLENTVVHYVKGGLWLKLKSGRLLLETGAEVSKKLRIGFYDSVVAPAKESLISFEMGLSKGDFLRVLQGRVSILRKGVKKLISQGGEMLFLDGVYKSANFSLKEVHRWWQRKRRSIPLKRRPKVAVSQPKQPVRKLADVPRDVHSAHARTLGATKAAHAAVKSDANGSAKGAAKGYTNGSAEGAAISAAKGSAEGRRQRAVGTSAVVAAAVGPADGSPGKAKGIDSLFSQYSSLVRVILGFLAFVSLFAVIAYSLRRSALHRSAVGGTAGASFLDPILAFCGIARRCSICSGELEDGVIVSVAVEADVGRYRSALMAYESSSVMDSLWDELITEVESRRLMGRGHERVELEYSRCRSCQKTVFRLKIGDSILAEYAGSKREAGRESEKHTSRLGAFVQDYDPHCRLAQQQQEHRIN